MATPPTSLSMSGRSPQLVSMLPGRGTTRVRLRSSCILPPRTAQDKKRTAARPAQIKPVLAMLGRSEEHTSELQSLMRRSYAVFCLKKKNKHKRNNNRHKQQVTNDTKKHTH